MEELIIYKYQLKDIENAVRVAMNVLDTRKRKAVGEDTAMDRMLLKAEQFIQEVLLKSNYTITKIK